MPLRRRLTAVFTFGTAVVMAVVGALFLLALRSGLTGNLDTTLMTRTSEVVVQLEADPTTAVATESSNGIQVQVLTRSGTVVDGSDALGDSPLLSRSQATAAATRALVLDRSTSLVASPGTSDGGPDDLRVVAVPGPGQSVVVAATSRDGVDNAVERAGVELLALSVVLVAIAALGAWLLARAALRPVESMRRQAAELRPTEAGAGIDVPRGRDELARLAVTFNDLLGRLHQAVDREQAFVADAGHELRTPLAVLQGELELARRPGRSLTDLQDTVAVAAQETDRLVRLSEDLLVLTRTGELRERRAQVDLVELVRDSVSAARAIAEQRDVVLVFDDSHPAAVAADGSTLRRAVDNVLGNALRFAPPDTPVEIAVSGDGYVHVVTVRDHGPGFRPDFIPSAFDRFTTADPTRGRPGAGRPHGAGLGLAIVAAIMSNHGGSAAVSNHDCGGAVVTLSIPRAESPDCGDTRS